MAQAPDPQDGKPFRAYTIDPDERATPRITLMLRAGKLILGDAEVLCVLRDVSEHGLKVRLFHPLPEGTTRVGLELGSGVRYAVEKIWEDADEAGFRFVDSSVELKELVDESGPFPRRHLRLKVEVPGVVKTLSGGSMCLVQDLSQLGALLVCDPPLPLGARATVSGPGLPELEGRIRWRRRDAHGLVFTRGFRLDELARLAAALQSDDAAPTEARSAG